MIAFPKLLLLALIVFAAWYAYRRISGPLREAPRVRPSARRAAAAGPVGRMAPAEDLLACDVCNAYVAASAGSCGRPDCPRPR